MSIAGGTNYPPEVPAVKLPPGLKKRHKNWRQANTEQANTEQAK